MDIFSTGVLVGMLAALWLKDAMKRSEMTRLIVGLLAFVILLNAFIGLGAFDSILAEARALLWGTP